MVPVLVKTHQKLSQLFFAQGFAQVGQHVFQVRNLGAPQHAITVHVNHEECVGELLAPLLGRVLPVEALQDVP